MAGWRFGRSPSRFSLVSPISDIIVRVLLYIPRVRYGRPLYRDAEIYDLLAVIFMLTINVVCRDLQAYTYRF